MRELSARGDRLCIVPQVLYEYFVVCTRPPAQYGGLGMSNEAAVIELNRLTTLFELLQDPPTLYVEWLRFIELYRVTGKQGHDTRLAAAMSLNGLQAVATFNVKDFARYSAFKILDPTDLAAQWSARLASQP